MRLVLAAVILASSPATAQAAKFQMQFAQGHQQKLRMDDGVFAIDSDQTQSSVRMVAPSEALKKRGVFQIIFFNKAGNGVNVGSENVTATLDDGTVVPIINAEQLAKEERRRQTWRAIAAGLAAAGNSMNAANSGYSHGTVSYSGRYGTSFGSYTSYNAGNAAVANSLANLQNQQIFDRLALTNAAKAEELRSFLRTTTVDSGDVKGGLVTFELPKSVRDAKTPTNINFAVTIGSDTHQLRAVLQPTR